MTKLFKLTPDLTCPELDGYKLPEITHTRKELAKVVEYMLNNPISTELRTQLELDYNKGVYVLSKYMDKLLRIPIAIEVEWIESWIGAEFDEPDTNEDGTVKGVYVYE
jgi:hypothetical protein